MSAQESAVEHRPAELDSQPLVVEDEVGRHDPALRVKVMWVTPLGEETTSTS